MLKQKWAKLHHEFFFIAFVNATVTKYGNKSFRSYCRVCAWGIIFNIVAYH